MTFLRLLPTILCALLMGAHALRSEWGLLAVAVVTLSPLLLLVRRPWVPAVARLLLAAGALEWLRTARAFAAEREVLGRPSARLWAILGGVAAFQLLSAALISGAGVRGWFRGKPGARPPA